MAKRFIFLILIFSLPLLAQGRPALPDFTLTNHEGKTFQLHDLKGKYVVVTFVFSRCPMPKMCPLSMRLTNQILREWKKELPKVPVHALAVTLDPQFDTPAVLKEYGKRNNVNFSQFTLATGEPKVLDSLASEFNVIGLPSAGIITHNMKTALIGPDMVPIQEFKDNEWKPEEVVAAAKRSVSR